MNRKEFVKLKINIASNWKRKMEEKSMTVLVLSQKTGITRTTIYNAFDGTSIPNLDTINKIEEVLND